LCIVDDQGEKPCTASLCHIEPTPLIPPTFSQLRKHLLNEKGDERGHVIRISLSPLMSREGIYSSKEVVRDQVTKDYLMPYMKCAFTKGDGMVGEI
jgi:hypothetical protein